MTDALKFVPPRVALVDPRTGMIAREWYLFLLGLYMRVGGAIAPSNSTLDECLQFDVREADAGELGKRLDEISYQLDMAPDQSAAVAKLRQITDDLQTIADSLSGQAAAQCAELAKRSADIETLQCFTR